MKLTMPDYDRLASWTPDEMPVGFVAAAGASEHYITGGWRTSRPVWDEDSCTHCLLCWMACPDCSVEVRDQKMVGIDLDHCKGCGLCATECRFGALSMQREDDLKGGN